jgi:O-antigen ligase
LSNSATASRSRAWLVLLTPVFVGLSLVLGGATHGEAISSAVVRLTALPLLAIALWALAETGVRRGTGWPLAVLAVAVALPLIQLIPVPPSVWTGLPGRAPIAEGFRVAGLALPWAPISLSPSATVDALLSLIPPAAVFLAAIQLDERARRRTTLVIIGMALVGTLVGAAQVASGQDSALRFYEVTNTDSAVGLFANRNHYAALLVIALPLTAYWLAYSEGHSRGQHTVYMLMAAGLLVVLIVSLGVARSRAGIGLGALALVLSAILLWFSRSVPRIVPVLLVAGLMVGGGLVSAFALEPLLHRFHDPVADARVTLLPGLIAAAKTYFPVGSGLGSFVPVYQMFERPETLISQYINHAHDDYFELLIETGLPGALVLLAGLGWFVQAAVRSAVWPQGRDPDLPRVAAVVVLILLIHSTVDYPLRTAAMAVVFAFACALLTPPVAGEGRRRRDPGAPANDAVRGTAARRLPSRPYVTTRGPRA